MNTHLILMVTVVDFTDGILVQLGGAQMAKSILKSEKKASNAVAAGQKGNNGLNGNEGFSSGFLTVLAIEIVNPCSLTVRTKGGTGGGGGTVKTEETARG